MPSARTNQMGARTIWESWEGTQAIGGVASLNHYSKGALCEGVDFWYTKKSSDIPQLMMCDGENAELL